MNKLETQFDLTKLIMDTPASKLGWSEGTKTLALYLSGFTNPKVDCVQNLPPWSCYPKVSTVAALVGVKEESLRKRFPALGEYVTITRRFNKSNAYTFNVNMFVSASLSEPVEGKSNRGGAERFGDNVKVEREKVVAKIENVYAPIKYIEENIYGDLDAELAAMGF